MTPQVGARFGPYEIQDRLGRGGMGLVFRAWDGRLHREVAIKLLHQEYPVPGSRERFLQEARAASALNHPNICTIFDIGEKDGSPYLVMELMEGETLRARIGRGALPVEDIVQYGQEIANALGAAHARGIVHRDVKPANIFLVDRPNGGCQTKVLDFGLAKVGGGLGGQRVTSDGATVGTVAYMSPEQARGEPLDARSDLFSLGVVMYEMATERVPFSGSTHALTFVQLLHHSPEPVRDWNEAVPKALEKVILKLLAKAPGERFQTAAEVSDALAASLGKNSGLKPKRGPQAAVPLVRPMDPVARVKRPVRRRSDASGADFEAAGLRGPSSREMPAVSRPLTEVSAAREEGEAKSWIRNFGRRKEDALQEQGSPPALPVAAAGVRGGSDSKVTPIRVAAVEDVEEFASADAGMLEVRPVPPGRVAREKRRRMQFAGVAAVVLIAVGGGFLVGRGRIFRGALLRPGERLMVVSLENRTGDPVLDGTLTEALELGLAESPYVALRGGDAARTALRQMGRVVESPMTPVLARETAQAAGAKVYVYGTVRSAGSGYRVALDVLDSATNRQLETVEETAAGRAELLPAVDRIVHRLREEMGEGEKSLTHNSSPLAQEATANLEALHAYSVATTAERNGDGNGARKGFEAAVKLDPRFIAAHLKLAWIYRVQHAEVLSAEAARLAEVATEGASQHTSLLAQYSYAVNATGDMDRAGVTIRKFVALFPHDPEGARQLARVLRLSGRFSEALTVAEKGIAEDPYDADLYGQAEYSLLGMDRYDAALGLEQQSQAMALPHGATTLTASYLAGKEERLAGAIEEVTRRSRSVNAMTAYGLYLDNTGQMAAGATLWSQEGEGLPWRLAQGALDRALAGECGAALAMVRRGVDQESAAGTTTTFNLGLAAALCGERATAEKAMATLKHDSPQSTAVAGSYLPDLRAAMALVNHDAQGSLDALRVARPYDSISLTPYLRGLAHVALHQSQMGEVDFQTVLGHRGIAVTGGSNVYPMAEMGLARAYAASGDRHNAQLAYRRFLDLWRRGDVGQRLRVEAAAGAR